MVSSHQSIPHCPVCEHGRGSRALVLDLGLALDSPGELKTCCSWWVPPPEFLISLFWFAAGTPGFATPPTPTLGDSCVQQSCKSPRRRGSRASAAPVGRPFHFLSLPGYGFESGNFLNGSRVKAMICQQAPKWTGGVSP